MRSNCPNCLEGARDFFLYCIPNKQEFQFLLFSSVSFFIFPSDDLLVNRLTSFASSRLNIASRFRQDRVLLSKTYIISTDQESMVYSICVCINGLKHLYYSFLLPNRNAVGKQFLELS